MGSGSSVTVTSSCRGSHGASPDSDCDSKLNENINEQLRQDHLIDKRTIKLLLLGAAESGKSTFAKQMRIIHCDGFSDSERISYKNLIHSNVLVSVTSILAAMDNFGISFDTPDRIEDSKLVNIYAELCDKRNLQFDLDVAHAIKRLSGDLAFQKCLARGREYQLLDSAEYYIMEVVRLASRDYVPTNQDILRTRQKTSGVLETNFNFRELRFRVFDVGGQRSERRKWIHFFDNVTAILFTAALSGYDQVLVEDGITNRLHESLYLFGSICNYDCFASTSIILFLNKKDIFQRKIDTMPLSVCFPEYKGPNEFQPAVRYIQDKFRQMNNTPKEMYCHVTVATDTQNINFVFDASMSVVLKIYLEEAGLF